MKEISGDDDIESTKRSFTDKKDLLIDLEQFQEANRYRWMIVEPRLAKACRFFGHCYNNIINDNNSTMNLMNKQTSVMISSE